MAKCNEKSKTNAEGGVVMKKMNLYESLPPHKIKVYHGTSVIITTPDLNHSKDFLDFGPGFYLSRDYTMARKWAVNKKTPIVNSYLLDISNLNCFTFQANEEWLDYIVSNRKGLDLTKDYSMYDIIIGPTADDRLFNALNDYLEGQLSKEITLKIINGMHFSNQYLIQTEKAIKQLTYIEHKVLQGKELSDMQQLARDDRIKGATLYTSLKQKYIGGTYYGG